MTYTANAGVGVDINDRVRETLVAGNIIGNNLGPHFFPLGSLAILM
jgi:Na+/H+ antiporter NhaD/arsenite permease-like protein